MATRASWRLLWDPTPKEGTLEGFQSTQICQDPGQTYSASVYPGLHHRNQQPRTQRPVLGVVGGKGHHVHHCTVRLSPKIQNLLCEDMQGWSLEPFLYAQPPPVPFGMLTTAYLSSRAPIPLVPSKTSLSCQA